MSFLDKFKFAKKPFKTTDEQSESVEVVEKKPKTTKTVKKDGAAKAVKTEKVEKEVKKVEKSKVRKEDTKDAHRVLVRPIISEKAADLSADGQYVFEVYPDTTKPEIRKAIKNVYGVMPVKVRIVNSAGKEVRFGRNIGKLRNKKKAIVTLKKGEKIEIYEGV
jgi:large subunit ribosomal protein L23